MKEYFKAKLYLFENLIGKRGNVITDETLPEFRRIKKIVFKFINLPTVFNIFATSNYNIEKRSFMNLFKPKKYAYAHCDLPCGVYDPAQARINAESVVNASKKYQDSDDPAFKQRCITIKEDMAEEVKKDLWVLWTDYFKPEHLEKFPNVHDLFWNATKKAGEAKKTEDPAVGEELLSLINEIDEVFQATKS